MAKIILPNKPLAVNPLKVSQPMGASLAFLGLARAMPLEHGALGCTAFSKVFFSRHFREPIPLQTTAMDPMVTVMGADDNVVEALRTVAEKHRPDIIGLLTTGLAETQGADIARTVKLFRSRHPEYDGMNVVPVSTPDTLGSLETGFASAVEAIINELVPAVPARRRRVEQVNVLVSSMLTSGDIEAVSEWIEAFGLHPVILPDIGDSMDNGLSAAGFSTLTYGGTPRSEIAHMGESVATLVIGPSLRRAADLLKARTGIADYRFAGLMGLDECDAFTQALSNISCRAVPRRIERKRAQLLDAMIDCHFQFSTARIAVAADADLLGMLTRFLVGEGAEVVAAVASARADSLAALPLESVIVGDLEDLENAARNGRTDLVIANSHGAETAARLGVPLMRAGFPQYDCIGGYTRTWIGYRGTRQILFDIANLLSNRQEIAPYRSMYRQENNANRQTAADNRTH
ncbi:nitrogenase iron-molybdenum cofactor biosynthesis protein NifN [Candidatus Methylospira mobilis]|uniref:Nitrogenase iron-molybdenum cofactor biosynthesis protein NifN n=1 Tax=Candidatus Methylospira mobilis TaxID=1808979 RepID=A0A5Q0BHB1_9GAMM|nr:nitrogenase iron-molybdenum cofactor biosynthesis protein NifN [Candidatus Methylospira mobilis]QFY41518.1 nitrogenase iron-molybdenum cofactor biosynthesis protein NifN [Candidatus Methylospira mobilis]WNV05246.1 nitrogenase iron-molybdenum cofactor biosynthesis protein NifN [Candidatus Methylospira mobilis]